MGCRLSVYLKLSHKPHSSAVSTNSTASRAALSGCGFSSHVIARANWLAIGIVTGSGIPRSATIMMDVWSSDSVDGITASIRARGSCSEVHCDTRKQQRSRLARTFKQLRRTVLQEPDFQISSLYRATTLLCVRASYALELSLEFLPKSDIPSSLPDSAPGRKAGPRP